VSPAHPATPFVALEAGQTLQRPPLDGIEYRFGLLLAVFGLVFLFSLPPDQAPDEYAHFLHAYDVAKGHLLPAHDSEGWAGTTLPPALLQLNTRSPQLWRHPDEKWTWQDTQDLMNLRFSDEKERPVSMAQASIYTFLPYLPQAAGIRLAHGLHLPPLPLFYAGRLGSLVFGVLCVMLAIRLTPIGKLLFGGVALLPLTVQQLASLSADGPTIGLSLVLVAALLRLALSANEGRLPSLVVGLLLLMFATALTKFPYTVLVLLYFGIAPEQVGSRRRYWLIGALVLAVTAIGLALSVTLTRPFILDPHRLREMPISESAQIHFLLTHPRAFLWMFLSNIAYFGVYWVLSLFSLGCLDTPLNPLTGLCYLCFLALLAVADRPRGELPWKLWGVGSAVVSLSSVMILTALYVWWNPPASDLLEGPQGRYFIPLMPLFFLLLRNGGIRVTADERFLARMTLAVAVLFLIYAWAILVNRFYFHEPPLLLAPPTLLSVGVLALLLCWAKYRWELAQATTNTAAPSACDASASSRPAA